MGTAKNTDETNRHQRREQDQDARPVSLVGRVIRFYDAHTAEVIIGGLVVGIGAGLFFGERCARLSLLGDAYIRLLQMTVLPYIVVALVSGFGRLSLPIVRRFAFDGGRLIVMFWGIGIALVFALSTIFPNVSSASFFSTSAFHEAEKMDPLRVFIPANPFGALAENLVPGVVLFSICIGVALIGVPEKQNLLDVLQNLNAAIGRVTKVSFKLAPFGIFAISASAAGTLRLAELSQLQVYLTGFVVGTLLLIFLLVPTLIAILTPIGMRKFLRAMWPALLLGFSAGSSFIVLPLLRDALEELFATSEEPGTQDRVSEAGIMIPVSYNFPLVGSTLNLLFILFTAWFYNKQLTPVQDVELVLSGILNFFGSMTVAIPFLLDQFQLPADAFELFMIGDVITLRLSVVGNIICIGGLAVLYVGLRSPAQKKSMWRALVQGAMVAVMFALVLLGIRVLEKQVVRASTADRDLLVNMKVRETVSATVFGATDRLPGMATGAAGEGEDRKPGDQVASVVPDSATAGADDVAGARTTVGTSEPGQLLSEIRARGVLRVGYTRNSLPFAFINGRGDLVGYDIAHAHRLAMALKCTLQFIPFDYAELAKDLDERRFDIAMSSVSLTESRLAAIDFTRPYLTVNTAFVTRDHQRANWQNPSELANSGTRIAVIRGSAYAKLARQRFPWAKLVEIENRKEFFESEVADAHLTTAEQGAAWTLLYPSFSVVISDQPLAKDPLAYAIPKGEPEFREYVSQWLTIIEMSGFSQLEYDRWILGRDPTAEVVPRWCIARDVLGWFE